MWSNSNEQGKPDRITEKTCLTRGGNGGKYVLPLNSQVPSKSTAYLPSIKHRNSNRTFVTFNTSDYQYSPPFRCNFPSGDCEFLAPGVFPSSMLLRKHESRNGNHVRTVSGCCETRRLLFVVITRKRYITFLYFLTTYDSMLAKMIYFLGMGNHFLFTKKNVFAQFPS